MQVLLAGKQDAEIERLLESIDSRVRKRIHTKNCYVTSEEELAAFKSADCVWLGYSGHYQMSGVLVQAGRAGIPVIACKEGLIGYYAAKLGNGILVDSRDSESVSGALARMVLRPNELRRGVQEAVKLFAKHNVGAAVDAIADVFRKMEMSKVAKLDKQV